MTDRGPAESGDEGPEGQDRGPVRLVLAAGICFGAFYLVAMPLLRPAQIGIASDVYHHAGSAVLAGENPYRGTPPAHPGFRFLYPPVVLLAVLPHALAGSQLGAFALQTAVNLAAAGALAAVLLRYLDEAGVALARRDRLLVAGFVLGGVHTVPNYAMGQVNVVLALGVAGGVFLLDRERDWAAGAAFALPAAVKVFPAAAGVWLVRRRAWRAVAGAVATGLGSLALGALAFGPALTWTYLTAVLPAERHPGVFAGGLPPTAMYVTVRRPLGALFPTVDPTLLALLDVALLVPIVAAASWSVATRAGQLVALLATLLATLLVLPLEPFYFALLYGPLVPLLYLLAPGRVRRTVLAGTLLLSAVLTYPAIQGILAFAPVGPALRASLDGAARAVFSVAQPPLLGALLLLAGCVLFQYRAATAGAPVSDDADTLGRE